MTHAGEDALQGAGFMKFCTLQVQPTMLPCGMIMAK